jgi:hypothetical protein
MYSAFLGRLRAFLILALLLLLGSLAQACSEADAHTLQIDFSASPDVLVGAELFVDGNPAGELRPAGSTNVSTFKVASGDHSLELRKEGHESQAFQLVGTEAGGTSLLTARAVTWFMDGQIKNAVILDR